MHINYVIVFVSDMARSVAFYRDLFGLSLKFESPEWTEFATEGATLALHSGDVIENETASKNQCRPGFCVENLEDFHQRMVDAGVECVQQPTEVFGTKVAQFLDPDKLRLSVSEVQPTEE